jgi:DNA transformation protein
MKRSEFVEYLTGDLLSDLPEVTSRTLFGGWALYSEGVVFAIVIQDILYFKVDETNKEEYEALGSSPFTYTTKNGKRVALSYFRIPDDIFEDRDEMIRLAEISIGISRAKRS